MKNSEEKEQLIEFPCDFSIKVIGKDCPEFLNSISEIMRSHSQVYSEKNAKKNKSKKGNYISITCDVYVKSCLLYTSPSPRDQRGSRMPSSA